MGDMDLPNGENVKETEADGYIYTHTYFRE